MDISKLKKGDIIIIRNTCFQVVEAWELDFIGSPEREKNWFRKFGLVKLNDGKMTISHILRYFPHSSKTLLKNEVAKKEKAIRKEEIKISHPS